MFKVAGIRDSATVQDEPFAMTTTVDERGAGGFAASRPDNYAVFLRARRHSRLVRMLRVGIPIGSVFILSAIWFVSWLDPIRILARLPTASGNLVISGSKITMEAPKLAGFTKDARAYELSARAAAQDITNPDVVELQDIRAKIESKDKSWINLTAVDGLYNRKSGILKLAKDVLLTSPTYEVTLDEALVDTTSNNVTSDKPVQVKMLQGVLNAKKLEVQSGGDVVRFYGDVKMTLTNVPNIAEKRWNSN
jgi:lipopolysaccharide export system protein LptC